MKAVSPEPGLTEDRHTLPETAEFLNDPVLEWVRKGLIGRTASIDTPYGRKRKLYFDYTASGLPFRPIEDLIREKVLPYMANTHTESNYTGGLMTALFEESHDKVRRALNAHEDDVILFAGSGATGAINKLIACMGLRLPPDPLLEEWGCARQVASSARPLVVRSRMEHHSNDLPWRETVADTDYIGYTADGCADWRELDKILSRPEYRDRPLKIGTFSAASNVTGIRNQSDDLARVMHDHAGYAFFDYAAAAPYVPIDMHPDPEDRARKDAVFLSVHKFTGGPQTPGVLAANRVLFRTSVPAEPGGGTVLYTSPWEYFYVDNIQHREEGGTPPIVQVIRAGLCFDLKSLIGAERLQSVEEYFVERTITAWKDNPFIRILGAVDAPRIGIISMILDNGLLHYNLGVRLLNDLYGIQVRGGCMCAGTYGHDLLGIDRETSEGIRCSLDQGDGAAKPGWIRVSFGPGTGEEEFRVLLGAIPHLARHWRKYADAYAIDPLTAEWRHQDDKPGRASLTLGIRN
ncbi:MAG: aminotransferase class V-fold PLP-dependent enzyme [Gammaproteobacteria bacterium]|nr:aminotransferase class V-fold PLP-dependent enzyme [Gammaproteobacteria bacterium]